MDLAGALRARLGAAEVVELDGGHQSRVFRATRSTGDPWVAKVTDARLAHRDALDARVAAVAALAERDPRVCRPLPIDGHLVSELEIPDGARHWVTCSELAEGEPPDPADPADAHAMGGGLAALHDSLRRLPPTPLPVVAALRTVPAGSVEADPHQLIHGDFRADNLRLDQDRLRIFDFDDCGYGPTALDVALALYVVLFDATTSASLAPYHQFRTGFVAGYVDVSGHALDEAEVDRFIDLRVSALEIWLDDLAHAPAGIRTSSPGWRATLRSFVVAHRGGPTTSGPGD